MRSISFEWNSEKYIFSEKGPALIIAEAGVNHNGNLELALKLIEQAKKVGADAVKFQTFKTENIIIPKSPKANYLKRTTNAKNSFFEILKKLELSKKDHIQLIKFCKKVGIIFFSTPYDHESADLLEDLDVPFYKIASTDLTNLPLLAHIAKKRKPMVISTGMSTLKEVKEAINICRKATNNNIILLQCTANYPTRVENANLRVLDYYRHHFKVLVGYSDQTIGETAAICAVAKNAVYIEKHFTIDRKLPGPDHPMSIEPDKFSDYIRHLREAESALGSEVKKITAEEIDTRAALQKSIVTTQAIKKDQLFTIDNIAIKRPALGLSPKYFFKILSKRSKSNIPINTPIKLYNVTSAIGKIQ